MDAWTRARDEATLRNYKLYATWRQLLPPNRAAGEPSNSPGELGGNGGCARHATAASDKGKKLGRRTAPPGMPAYRVAFPFPLLGERSRYARQRPLRLSPR